MNPYAPPQLPRLLTKDEKRQLIANHPDTGILGVLLAKYPKTFIITTCLLVIALGIITVEIAIQTA